MFDVDTWRQDRDAAELQSGSLPADQRRLADPSTESARKNVEKEKQQYMSQICEVILSQISKKKTINFWKWGAGGSLRSKKIVAEFLDFRKKRNKFSETRGWGGRGVKGRLDFFSENSSNFGHPIVPNLSNLQSIHIRQSLQVSTRPSSTKPGTRFAKAVH